MKDDIQPTSIFSSVSNDAINIQPIIVDNDDEMSVTFSNVWNDDEQQQSSSSSSSVVVDSGAATSTDPPADGFIIETTDECGATDDRSQATSSPSFDVTVLFPHTYAHQTPMTESDSMGAIHGRFSGINNNTSESGNIEIVQQEEDDVPNIPTAITVATAPNSRSIRAARNGAANGSNERPIRLELRNYRRVVYWTCRLICFPIWLLVSVFTVTTVISFCILPGILLICILISCYYCCSRDPIPFNVLMRALFLDDENEANINSSDPTLTKEEIHELLIRRQVMEIVIKNGVHKFTTLHQPNHSEISSDKPIHIITEHALIKLSKPISINNSMIHEEDDDADDEWNESRMSFELANRRHSRSTVSSVDAIHSLRNGNGSNDDELQDTGATTGSNVEMPTISTIKAIPYGIDDDMSRTEENCKIDNSEENNGDDDESDSLGCDICLRKYEVNDVISWSKNESCIHAYHLDCITDWLQRKVTCPNCRCLYIPRKKSQRPSAPNNAADSDTASTLVQQPSSLQFENSINPNTNRSSVRSLDTAAAVASSTTTTAVRTSALLSQQQRHARNSNFDELWNRV